MLSPTILVVDEPRAAQAVKAILSPVPYNVLTASGIEEASAAFESEARVELVLAELLLPGGASGNTFIDKVRHKYPSTAVMLMTGLQDWTFGPGVPVLVKPFLPAALIKSVAELLLETWRTVELLEPTAERNRTALEEMRDSKESLVKTIRVSRQLRAERFRSRLRMPGVTTPTILVVDDDLILRYSVCRFLIQCGLQVLAAANGAEALEISRQHEGQIAVLLTDLQMPRLDGLELIRQLAPERPQTKVLVMSGDDVILQSRMLRKPFELDDLLIEIASVLAGQVDI
ncbi:MAG TPA: response regulator [Bryobacteraceae bacterium]|nr:response regulator [Bryobacteraceae bacterium]